MPPPNDSSEMRPVETSWPRDRDRDGVGSIAALDDDVDAAAPPRVVQDDISPASLSLERLVLVFNLGCADTLIGGRRDVDADAQEAVAAWR